MSCNSKCCCEVLIIRNRKVRALKGPVTPWQFPHTVSSLSLLPPSEALSHNPKCKRSPGTRGDPGEPPGQSGALAPTSLHSSWQQILNEATHDCAEAHPGRGSSPGSNPLMDILKETVFCFLSRNTEISQTFPFIIPPTALRRLRG